jgi:hypothetical protein
MITFLLIVGLLIEIALGAYVVLLTRLERKTLRTLVEQAGADFVAAVDDLPDPYRGVARPLADQLAMAQDFDDALLDAVVDTTRQPFKKPLWLRLTVGVICSIALLAPASYGLLATASQIVSSWNESKGLDRSLVYLRSQTEFSEPFMLLRDAFQASALLFFGLAFLWALAWYLRRPEVREARFVRALLEAAARASPKSAAPVSGRLSELIAPDRGLTRPITALAICFAGITAGWMVLYQTADVRAANDREPVFHVWPAKNPRPVAMSESVQLPVARAGSPMSQKAAPSLVIGPDKVTLSSNELLELEKGRLPDDWQSQVSEDLGTKLVEGRVVLLAHKDLPLGLVLELITYLQAVHDVERFDLIVERALVRGGSEDRLQAAIQLELGSDKVSALQLVIGADRLRVLPSTELRYDSPDWRERLHEIVRNKSELLRNEQRAPVELFVESGRIDYERFVEVLAAADTACLGKVDCGLPGLGLSFIFPTKPSP